MGVTDGIFIYVDVQISIQFQVGSSVMKEKNKLLCEKQRNLDEVVRKCSTLEAVFKQAALTPAW